MIFLIGRLKLVRCSLYVVIWLVAKPKLLLQKKKKIVNREDEARPLNRATCTDVVTKNRTTLYFLQQMFATVKNLICCKAGLKVGGKTSNIAFQLVCSNVAKQVARFCWPFYHRVKGAVSRQSSSFCLILPITRPQSLWNLK